MKYVLKTHVNETVWHRVVQSIPNGISVGSSILFPGFDIVPITSIEWSIDDNVVYMWLEDYSSTEAEIAGWTKGDYINSNTEPINSSCGINDALFPWGDERLDTRLRNSGNWRGRKDGRPKTFNELLRIGRSSIHDFTRNIGMVSIAKLDVIFREKGLENEWLKS
jgi:hypothetical protein